GQQRRGQHGVQVDHSFAIMIDKRVRKRAAGNVRPSDDITQIIDIVSPAVRSAKCAQVTGGEDGKIRPGAESVNDDATDKISLAHDLTAGVDPFGEAGVAT